MTQHQKDAAFFASQWVQKAPHLNFRGRLDRAVELVATVEPDPMSASLFYVRSASGAGGYWVRAFQGPQGWESSCECPDSAIRGNRCKHRLAAALFVKVRAEVRAVLHEGE